MKNRVRELRELVTMTQAELASELKVSRQTIISIEGGKYTPSLPLAFALARFFEVPMEEMFDADA